MTVSCGFSWNLGKDESACKRPHSGQFAEDLPELIWKTKESRSIESVGIRKSVGGVLAEPSGPSLKKGKAKLKKVKRQADTRFKNIPEPGYIRQKRDKNVEADAKHTPDTSHAWHMNFFIFEQKPRKTCKTY